MKIINTGHSDLRGISGIISSNLIFKMRDNIKHSYVFGVVAPSSQRIIPCAICEKTAFLVAIETAGDAYRCEDGHNFVMSVVFVEPSLTDGYVKPSTQATRRI